MSRSGTAAVRRSRRVFNAFLLISLAAHAAVFGVLPMFTSHAGPAPAGVLQVSLLDPLPLPVGPPEPAPQSPPRAEKHPAPRASGPAAREVPPALALPETQADERRAFAAGSELAEPAVSLAPEPSPATAGSVTLHSLNAAYLSNPLPSYPAAARRAGEQGTVMLRVLVSREGAAARVELDKSSGSPHLDVAARETVKAWRFTPARRGGETIESWMVVPVVFRLETSG